MSHRTAEISRRAAIGTLAAGGLAFLTFGGRSRKQQAPSGRLVLDYWEKWTGHEGLAMQRVVEASMEFIAYTQRQDNVEALATAHCKGSPMVRVSDAFLAAHPNRGVQLHTALASSPRAFIAPPTPVWPEYKDLFDTTMMDLWKQAEPAAMRLPTIQTRAQAMLDQARAYKAKRGEL